MNNRLVRLNKNIKKKIKYFSFSIDKLLYKVVYYIQIKKTRGKPNETRNS